MKNNNVLIIGGAGYKGIEITNLLLENNYNVTILDTFWFGDNFKKDIKIKKIKKDFRKISNNDLKSINTVIHLANIANDPGVELLPQISWDVNVLGTKMLIEKCIKNKVKHFLYASSGSVYGVSKKREVTEETELLPISTYNKTKMIAEQILNNYKDKLKIHIIRPATVCGYSPRLRLDVSVNLLTNQALKKKKMTVLGGKQIRPNIHIKDMARVYLHFIKKPSLPQGIYNAGFENLSIIKIAKLIKKQLGTKILYKKSNDKRSYRLDSTKLIKTGFKPIFNVNYAIKELISLDKFYRDTSNCYNVKTMKKLKLK